MIWISKTNINSDIQAPLFCCDMWLLWIFIFILSILKVYINIINRLPLKYNGERP